MTQESAGGDSCCSAYAARLGGLASLVKINHTLIERRMHNPGNSNFDHRLVTPPIVTPRWTAWSATLVTIAQSKLGDSDRRHTTRSRMQGFIADYLVPGCILRRSLKPCRNRIRQSGSGADPPGLWVGEDAQAFRVWFSVQACGFRRLFLRRRGRASPFYSYPAPAYSYPAPALIVPSQALLRRFQERLVRDEVPGLSL